MLSYDNYMTCLTTCLKTVFVNLAPGSWMLVESCQYDTF